MPLSEPPICNVSESTSSSLSPPATLANLKDPVVDVEITENGAGPSLTLAGSSSPVLNVATANYLGLLKHPIIEKAVLDTMQSYGLGSCGPRGFYGTTDIHLECEDTIAKFCNTSTAILYSFGAATGNSTIPAFMKRGDLIVMDSALNHSLRLGVQLSRARVLTFEHNDMQSLRAALLVAVKDDVKNPSLRRTQRRLIIVEGISDILGDVCPLDEVVKLKEEFNFRILLDESHSLGVLGSTGRGSLEEFNVPRSKVEISTADLGNAIASVGGFCVGSDDVVDHQRLSGAGYCFSASQPPFLAKAATAALNIVKEQGNHLVSRLRKQIQSFVSVVDSGLVREAGWTVLSDPRSPLVLFHRTTPSVEDGSWCSKVVRYCLDRNVLVASPTRRTDDTDGNIAPRACAPAIRASLSIALSNDETIRIANVVRDALCMET